MDTMRSVLICSVLLVGVVLLTAEPALAQRGDRFGGYGRGYRDAPLPEGLQGDRAGFSFCRLVYRSSWREQGGRGWVTDYPNADRNLMFRTEELTTVEVSKHRNGDFAHSIVTATHKDLFKCPFLFASDVGTMSLSAEEVAALRQYFAKGGFLWVDDFWGQRAWRQFETEMERVMPGRKFVELAFDEPMLNALYRIREIPQISNIGFWRGSGGETRERGAESPVAHIRALYDEEGRLVVMASFDTDLADGWEREADDRRFFELFSPEAYAIGTNVLVWIMTH
jgi:hypothetical protein